MKTRNPSHQKLNHRVITRRAMLALMCATPALLAACGGEAASGPQPPQINYGYDICAHCGMVISDARFAAATSLENGEARKFDNVGDMIAYHAEHVALRVTTWWAHDYASERWINALTAHYVLIESGQTCGLLQKDVVAFDDTDTAQTYASKNDVSVQDWEDVRLAIHQSQHSHSS
jgi:copper chaperone NosL